MRWCVLFVLCACVSTAHSQNLVIDNECYHYEGGMSAGLNNDGYQIDLGVAWFPVRFFGVKATLGFAGEIEEIGDWGGDETWNSREYDYAIRLKLLPAVVFRTPRLVNWNSQGGGFHLFAEPGFLLSPGAAGSRHARIFCYDLKAGINLQLERIVLSLGYGVSDFSLYSGRPINHHGLPDRDNYITHSVFVSASYKF